MDSIGLQLVLQNGEGEKALFVRGDTLKIFPFLEEDGAVCGLGNDLLNFPSSFRTRSIVGSLFLEVPPLLNEMLLSASEYFCSLFCRSLSLVDRDEYVLI